MLAKLQLKLSEIAVASKVPLEFGYVDGVAGSRICLTNESSGSVFIEVKTGRTKLVQPAIYTFLSGTKTLVADLKAVDVLSIDVRTAERIVKEFVTHLKDKEVERVRKKGTGSRVLALQSRLGAQERQRVWEKKWESPEGATACAEQY